MRAQHAGRWLVLLAASAALAFTAADSLSATTTVRLTSANRFDPSTVSVAAGDTVRFVWESGFHNVVFEDGPRSGDPTGQTGTTWERAFAAAGTFRFECEVHAPDMAGTVTVTQASPTPTPSGPAASPTQSPSATPSSTLAPTAQPTATPAPTPSPSRTATPFPIVTAAPPPPPAVQVAGTSIAAVQDPVPGTSTAAGRAGRGFPRTGPESSPLSYAGALSLAAGAAWWGRRRLRRGR